MPIITQEQVDAFDAVDLGLSALSWRALLVLDNRLEVPASPSESRPTGNDQIRASRIALGILSQMWQRPKYSARFAGLVREFIEDNQS